MNLSYLKNTFKKFIDEIDQSDLFYKFVALSFIFSVAYSYENPWNVAIQFVFAAALFFNKLFSFKSFWCLILLLFAPFFINYIELVDNHYYLFNYIVLMIIVSLGLKNKEVLVLNSRYILGIAFLIATFWKVYDGEYLNGYFFEVSFLSDSRFKWFVDKIFGYSIQEASFNYHYAKFTEIVRMKPQLMNAQFIIKEPLQIGALIFSWGTIVFEAILGTAFIIKAKFEKMIIGDILLIGFLMGTYLLAPVTGFSMLLASLGYAQAKNKYIKAGYVLAFLCQVFPKLIHWRFTGV
jgi:hypothetical protein